MDIEKQPLIKCTLIDTIIDNYGYGIKTMQKVILIALFWMLNGLELTNFSTLLNPYIFYFTLNSQEIQIGNSVFFAGTLIGFLLIPFIIKIASRSFNIGIGLIIMTISHFIMSIAGYFWIFCVFRLIIGITLAIVLALGFNSLSESLPKHNRAFTLSSVMSTFSLGQLFFVFLMFMFMPNEEPEYIQSTSLVGIILLIFTLIYFFLFFEESPRYLILNDKFDEA
jgi:MFS family permease